MKSINNAFFLTAISISASGALAAPSYDDCAEIKSLSVVATGTIMMDVGEFFSDNYWFHFACGPWETAPLSNLNATGFMSFVDGNQENMAGSWSVANTTLHESGFELMSFTYAIGRYNGIPSRHYGYANGYSGASGLIEVTEPTRMTLTMEVDSEPFHYVHIDWERVLERVEWRDHGELGSGYFPVETIIHDQYQNFVRNWNDYDTYVTGIKYDREVTIDLAPGIYQVRTNTAIISSPESYGIVGLPMEHHVTSRCNVDLECIWFRASDINGDYQVNGSDLTILLGDWGTSSERADIDGSGLVDGADLTILMGDWD